MDYKINSNNSEKKFFLNFLKSYSKNATFVCLTDIKL